MPSATPALGQQLAAAGFARVSLPQSHQPVYETDVGTTFPGLAGALGPSPGDGGDLCGPTALSGYGLQSQRMVAPGKNRRLETRRLGLLSQTRCSQTDLGAGTGQERAGQIERGPTAARVGYGGGSSDSALPEHRQGNPQSEGKRCAGSCGNFAARSLWGIPWPEWSV
jgi:hypothetical protein